MRVEVEKLPGVMASEVAFVTFQLRVDVPAEATTVGLAEKEEMVGSGFCTFTVVDAVEELFHVSVESTQRVVDPFVILSVFQGIE